jgi:DNA-binding transcriptional ArsR family regulator
MVDSEEQVESIVFQALSHPMRRTILKIIASRSDGVSYTELITELGLSSGKLNYHLEQLVGFAAKNEKRLYILTPLGKKALNQLNLIKEERSSEDEKYVRIAQASQKSSIQPAMKSFLLVGIAFSCVILAIWIYLTYFFITEGAPIIVYVIMPILIAAGIGLLGSLILALKRIPEWVRRLEHRFMGPA